ncbi:MAG: outer membrane lipoprotein carrier protein LolA [Pseudomonadota bacterium]
MIAVSLLIGWAPLQASADSVNLNEISAYLNSLKSVSGSFTQINDDGTISTGEVFIKRPGRIRFEYDPPNEVLVIGGGGQVAIFDDKSNQPPEQYPLKRTPLNLILARNVDLSRANMVVGFEYDGTATTIIAQDPENPDYGTIQLKFTGPTVELRQWIITSGDGTRTTVTLNGLEQNAQIAAISFSIQQEINRRNR